MRGTRATLAAGAALALAGCGAASPSAPVRAKVEQFARAAASRNYSAICDQVLAVSLLERIAAAGISCEAAMEAALGNVSGPTLSIGRITVTGRGASVITLTTAEHQPASLDAIQLVQTGSGWRISSLGNPVNPGSTR